MKNDFAARISSSFLLLLALLLGGCVLQSGEKAIMGSAQGEVIVSHLARIADPQVPESDQDELSNGNRAFASDLYQQLRARDGNLFLSPYSISLALAMTYGGARGETARQMERALHFTLPPDRLHPAFNALDQHLVTLSPPTPENQPTPTDAGGQDFQLSIANSIWGQEGFDFLTTYLDLLAQQYGAGLRLVDFAGSPEAARQGINDWVSAQTQEKIKDLLPQGAIDLYTRLVLVNAIYFKASWLDPFFEQYTTDGVFHINAEEQVTVPMMASTLRNVFYGQGDGYQAVGLPYVDQKTMMVVILPDQGKFNQVEMGLDAAKLDAILDGLSVNTVELTFPKFKIESSFNLPDVLSEMGMIDAFDPNKADFSGMDGRTDLFISDVVHKAYVAVDEKGTEAAAATGVVIMEVSAPLSPTVVRVDRPFIFFIYERDSATILFIGRVIDPSK
jgi:serpin B